LAYHPRNAPDRRIGTADSVYGRTEKRAQIFSY
jgi:hypothetical protein